MYITNFNILAQFGGELWEEQPREMIEMKIFDQITTSLGLRTFEMRLKYRDRQKVHLGHILNIHIKFQHSSPIWRRDRGATALF